MKTLVFFLAAALASPAFGHTDNASSTTTTDTTSTTVSSPNESSESDLGTSTGNSAMDEDSMNSDSSMAGSSSSDTYKSDTSYEDSSSSLSGSSTDYNSTTTPNSSGTSTSDMDRSSSNLNGSATRTPTTAPADTSSSWSGASSDTTTTTPSTANTAAPAATAPVVIVPQPAPAAQTSAAPQENTGHRLMPGGFFIEPGLVGTRRDNDLTGVAGGGTSDSTAFGADLKLGGHINESFFLALDGRYERAKMNDIGFDDTNADVYNWGPTLGFQAPQYGMRAWATYVVDGVHNPEASANGTNLEFRNPYGWRGGVGVRFASVSVNVEYEDLTYRTTNIESLGAGAAPAAIDFDQRGYALSLSFPIEL